MKQRLIATCVFIACFAILIKVMVFKDLPLIRIGPVMFNFGGAHEGPANLLPFKTILPYLLGKKGLVIAGINLIGNIVLLVPIGFLVPFVFRNITWKKTLVPAVAAGFAIEEMQALLHVGIFDIDDIILNGIGVMVGYWAFTIFIKMARPVKFKIIIITAFMVIVIAVAAAFYGVDIYQKDRLPERFGPVAGNGQADSIDNGKNGIIQSNDPCGGTGQIVSVGNNSITIKRHDGISVTINFTARTTIRNSAGAVSKADLKIGDRVTVVVDVNRDGSQNRNNCFGLQ